MKRKSKYDKAAEEIVHAIRLESRVSNNDSLSNMSDDYLKGLIVSVLKLWYKPIRRKKDDGSWKETRSQCS